MFRILVFTLLSAATILVAEAQLQSRIPADSASQTFPTDSLRVAEMREMVMTARMKQHEAEAALAQQQRQRQFATRFNELVDAVAAFSKRYNEARGSVWPQREAEKLRKAIRHLQQVEKSLRDEPATAAGGEQ